MRLRQTMAGRVVAATFRKPGTHRRAGRNLATLESGKWVGGVPAPFDATTIVLADRSSGTP